MDALQPVSEPLFYGCLIAAGGWRGASGLVCPPLAQPAIPTR